tara:strand:+ start:7626 stop:11294 length:3669 start_codon:yes stop_codon:yes gene_type:complete
MENYSIFGSNIENDYLLKLQNNESNIKIDIHNNDHNFTINYVNSNEIITNYNTLGLQDITKIDENNYIHKSILNSSNVIIQGKYGLDANNPTEKYFGNLNQNISEKFEIVVKSSKFFFNNYDGFMDDDQDYHKYSSCNLVINDDILKNYKFYDSELQLEESLSGIFIYLKFDKKHNIIKYRFFEYIDTALVFPHEVIFYQVFDKNAYFINKQKFETKSDFDRDYIIENNSYVSDAVLIQIQSVLIQKVDLLNEINDLIGSDARERGYVKEIDENNKDSSNFNLNVAFKGIELFTTNEILINEYDIDMSNNSIQNVNTLSLDRLILNNVIYTNVVSTDSVLETVNEVISNDKTIGIAIVDTYLKSDQIGMDPGNLTEMFNNSRIEDITSNLRSNLDKKYIPYVYLKDDNKTLKIEYDSSVNIKYLLNLDDLDDTDKLMKHSNGIIYKENKVDNLEITENLNILSNLNVNGDITINSNILKWDNNIDKFKHSNGKIIQDEVIDMLSYEPNMKDINGSTISFDTDLDAFTLTYSNNDKPYYIRHPFNFIKKSTTGNDINIPNDYINSTYTLNYGSSGSNIDCNLKIQFLDLITELNLYISSRFGNIYNLTLGDSKVILQADPQIIEDDDDREIKLYYSNNNFSSNYLDYYEYEVPEKVLLKEISFYDIEFEDYDNLLKNYYQYIIDNIEEINEISDLNNEDEDLYKYKYTHKNYLLNFDVIGYDNGWELIQNILFTEEKTLNQYKNKKITSNKKYSRYRIALKEAENTARPFIIKDLKFHIEYNKNNKNILYDGDNINFNITNLLSINNSIKWNDYFNTDDKIRTKLIINDDQPSIKYFNDTMDKRKSYAVCHINENVDNSNLVENHMLKFGLFNIDSELPSVDDYKEYNLSKNTPSVYHSLHLMNSNLYYSQSVINNFYDINNNGNYNEFLILTENKFENNNLTGLASINIPKEHLSNIINHNDRNISNINGLIVNPMMRLCAFNNENGIKNYMDIGLNSNLTLDNSYRIELPDNSCNINVEEAYYLKPIVDHTDKVIKTEWSTLGSEVFIKNNIYIGNPDNSNILNNYVDFCNIHPTTKENTEEYLTHIRKLIIGYPDDIPLEKINSNVLTIGGSVYATHDVSTDSDIAYKYNLEKIEDARYKVEQLNGYTFDRNDTNDERRYCGLIAQEIEKVIPEVIVKKHDGKMRVLYNNLAGLFVECFKDLYKEIDELKKEVYNHKVEQ